jgi:hypothetical protein
VTQKQLPEAALLSFLASQLEFFSRLAAQVGLLMDAENELPDIKQGSCKDTFMGTLTRQTLCSHRSLKDSISGFCKDLTT